VSATLERILAAPGGGELGDREVVDGIPVLLPPGAARGRSEIVEAFRERSTTYYGANYEPGANPERERRQELVVELLRSVARPGDTVLDAGAGPAVLAEPARSLGLAYVALDLSLDNLRAGRTRIGDLDAVVGDLTAIPVKTGAVDGAVAIGSLEYVPNLAAAVAELCRVVRPGGFLVATFANARSPRRRWDETVVAPAIRLRAALRGTSGSTYRRYLSEVGTVTKILDRGGADVREVRYVTAGLVGYPLSQLALARRLDFPERLRSEFVVVARRRT
jgi:ubiquinone/menaquinone biosynthesis C-methylase UbiE